MATKNLDLKKTILYLLFLSIAIIITINSSFATSNSSNVAMTSDFNQKNLVESQGTENSVVQELTVNKAVKNTKNVKSSPQPYNSRTGLSYNNINDAVNSAQAKDTIILPAGTYTGKGNYNININKDLTIIGNSPVDTIIDAQRNSRIFIINSGVNVSLIKIHLERGRYTDIFHPSEGAGDIFNQGNLTLQGVLVQRGEGIFGAGIGNNGNLTVNDCYFWGNIADNDFLHSEGGAIYNRGIATITNTTFDNNRGNSGGVIVNENQMTILGSTFIRGNANSDNVNSGYGGAIYNKGKASLSIKNCNITQNQGRYGGAIYNESNANITLQNSPVTSNTARIKNGGGGIYNEGIIAVDNAQNINGNSPNNITGNSLRALVFNQRTGDAYTTIQAAINAASANDTLNLDGTYYENLFINKNVNLTGQDKNTTTLDGQGRDSCIKISNSTVNISNLNIINGLSSYAGGGINNQGGTVTLNNCNISNCRVYEKSKGEQKVYGGAINNAGYLTVNNCIISGNSSGDGGYGADGGYGGGICNWGTLNIAGCNFSTNKANLAYYQLNDFSYVYLGGLGGAIYSTGTATISSTTFDQNVADLSGGAIYNSGSLTATGNNFFTNNKVKGKIEIVALIPKKLVGGYGGAIYSENNITLSNNTFTGNTAVYGAAVSFHGNNSLNIKNNTFNKNNVLAVDNNGNPMKVLTFDEKDPLKVIGTILVFARGLENLILDYHNPWGNIQKIVESISTAVDMFHTNQIEASGGAIHIMDNVSLKVDSCTFDSNSAASGGAIHNFSQGTLTITNSEFEKNTSGLGGAIYTNHQGSLEVTNCTFNSNHATSGGGAICHSGKSDSWGDLKIQQNIFIDNSANLGDVIYDDYKNVSHIYINFNRIYGTGKYGTNGNFTLYHVNGKMDAKLNWWGSNDGPGTYQIADCNVDYSPWMRLTITIEPKDKYYYGDTLNLTADLLHDSRYDPENPNASKHDPTTEGLIPDGLMITFSTDNGNISPSTSTVINGIVKTSYTANGPILGVTNIYANTDNTMDRAVIEIKIEAIPTTIVIQPVKNSPGKTVNITAQIIDGNLNQVTEGTVTFKIGYLNPSNPITVDKNGIATHQFTIPKNWPIGIYPIEVKYSGEKYASSEAQTTLTLEKPKDSDDANNSQNGANGNHNKTNRANAATNTNLPMENTGLPLFGILLAALMVLGGVFKSKKR